MDNKLIFLKLGGSLITKKDQRSTYNEETLHAACAQIARFQQKHSNTKLLVGHGSGSFGHFAAAKHGTREGYQPGSTDERRREYWDGFLEVYEQARVLNNAVLDGLRSAGARAIGFSPNTAITASDRKVSRWDTTTIQKALEHGFIPVVFGDVIFDEKIGGTIFSTEDLFEYLAISLRPDLILLAGIEQGVWADYPKNQDLIERIDTTTYKDLKYAIQGSSAVDVTGGMDSKIAQMARLISAIPTLRARIFSGIPEDNIYNALIGEAIGTLLSY